MKIVGRLFIVFIVVLLALIPGAYATTVSTGSGTSISGTGSAQGNFAANGVQTTGFAVANGPSVNADHWVQDITGKRVEVDVNVPRADKVNWHFSLGTGNNYDHKTIPTPQSSLTAQECLDVTNAKTTIQADAIASSGEGDNAQVGINMGPGSLVGYQNSATASEFTADSWQKIASASGDNIELSAKTYDGSGKNEADSSVTINHDASLKNYNSEAGCSITDQSKDVDLYAMHGAVVVGTDSTNPAGSISGDTIVSKGSTTNQMGLSADYGVTINHGTVDGIFDWGTETKSNGGIIAVPLESPAAWGGPSGTISIYGQCHNKAASKIVSNSEAYLVDSKGKIVMVSQDDAKAKNVKVGDWKKDHGFAKSSQAGNL